MATRWGIVSAGKISNDFTSGLRSLSQDEHNVVAVAARDLSSAKQFAALHEIPKAYGSYEELAKDTNVQVVYIGSINPTHLPIGKLMLEHGKHLLVEKPLTLNSKQTDELLNLAKSKGLFIMEAIWSRFLPSYQFVMEQIADNAIGDVVHTSVTFGMPIANVDRVAKKSMGGSTVLDIGVYCINLILMSLNSEKPQEIKATGHLNSDGVDESVSAALRFSNGVTATMSTHSKCTLPCEGIISGTKGTIVLRKPMWCADTVEVNGVEHKFPYPDSVGPLVYDNSQGLRYQAIEVRRCLQEDLLESPVMSHEHSRLIASIEDELRRQVGVVFDED